MSTIDSNSTYAEVLAAYADNASYDEDGSITKAKRFVTACLVLLAEQPKRERTGGNNETEFNSAEIRQELEAARRWLAQKRSQTGGHRHYSLRNFRG